VSIEIGTSGWSYGHWDGVLYPAAMPPAHRLAIYTQHFATVELNASFYRWPSDATFASWRQRSPEGFQLTVKAPRGLTHAKKLYDPQTWIARITAGLHELGDRREVFLVQLGPNQARDDARLDYFLSVLADSAPWIRLAVEFRHPSWPVEDVFRLLERHNAAYCVMSGSGLPCILRATADFVYVRLHGPDDNYLYGGSYSDADLRWWADRIREWSHTGRSVYAYFNNDGFGHAVRNAMTLRQFLDA
jgi:uncharacterized protein YecE (DUF72 family)